MAKHIFNLRITRQPANLLKLKKLEAVELPPSIDLRDKMPTVYDQGNLGSCTANALGGAYEYLLKNKFTPSRLFIYYNERKYINTVKEDSGADLSDGIKSLKEYGVCDEQAWPYDIKKFQKKPSRKCYKAAYTHRAVQVENISQDIKSMKTSLANGLPFVIGFSVYDSFETDEVAKTGIAPLPDTKSEKLLGGHAVLVCGYDDEKSVWKVRNSWGDSWGDKGYFTVPYEYFTNTDLSSDIWSIDTITDPVNKSKLIEDYKEEFENNFGSDELTYNLLQRVEALEEEIKNLKTAEKVKDEK